MLKIDKKLDFFYDIKIYNCDSIKGLEDEILNNRKTKGKGGFEYSKNYSVIQNISKINEHDSVGEVEFRVLLGTKDEINKIEYTNLKNSYTNTFAFIIDDNFIKEDYQNMTQNIDKYIIVKNTKDLVLATQSLLDFIEKSSYIGVDYDDIFEDANNNNIMYFETCTIKDIYDNSFRDKLKEYSKVIPMIYFYNENLNLIKMNEVMTSIDISLEENTVLITCVYEALDKDTECIRLFLNK